MSEQTLQCDRCGLQVSSLNITVNHAGSDWLCPKCALLDEAQFCREEGLLDKAMELEAKANEIKQ